MLLMHIKMNNALNLRNVWIGMQQIEMRASKTWNLLPM